MNEKTIEGQPDQHSFEDSYDLDSDANLCECGEGPWEMCDCGQFFLNWMCGMGPDGQCSLAGSEDCDWECPLMGGRRAP